MEPYSRSNNLSAAIVLLLAVVMAGGMALVEADQYKCYRLSGQYRGWCGSSNSCWNTCTKESYDYYGGKCQGWLPARCWCRTCPYAAGVAAAPATVEGGGGGAAAAIAAGGLEHPIVDGREFPAAAPM